MIRLEHITKVFHKNKRNQCIVANDISLTFEPTGLVVVLGASGSGKTTLLNIISGMDKFDKGRLIFDDVVFDSYNQRKWDTIRKHKIGYVHQNYHLLKELSVYKNIEPILRMQGITDPGMIKERIIRLLSTVGLSQYSDRLVKQLSGGQQQRIAFARALANNPMVILADEPTGNLDSKNTIELMNVIKEIAKTRLVIMVTHEQQLCDYFADRILEIENGTIVKDYHNDMVTSLAYHQEHILQLREFQKTSLENSEIHLNRYTKPGSSEPLELELFERNQTLYWKFRSQSILRTKYIGDDSEIIVQDGTEATSQTINPFLLADLLPSEPSSNPSHVFSWKEIARVASRKLHVFRGGGKLLFGVLMLVGMIISISVGLIGELYHVEPPFSTVDPHYITVTMDHSTYAEVQAISLLPGVDQVVLINQPFSFMLSAEPYYEVHTSIRVSAVPIDILFLDAETIVYGRMPQGYEVVIDQSVANAIIRDNAERGIDDFDDVLKCRFKLQTNGIDLDLAQDSALYFSISGIADNGSQSVWMSEELMYSLVVPRLVDVRLLGDDFHIVSGTMPATSTYVMLNDHFPSVLTGDTPDSVGIATGTYYIAGIYEYVVDGVSYNLQNAMITTLDHIKERYYIYQYSYFFGFELFVYATDVEAALVSLREAGYSATANVFEPSLAQQLKLEENRNLYWLGIGGLLMSAFSILLIMRSSLIARMYEVSVYRSIGISRKEIRRIFLMEILMITSLSSVIGFALMMFLLSYASSTLSQVSIAYFTLPSLLLGILGMYAINWIFGMIPIQLLLAKTPSNIMKQSDI